MASHLAQGFRLQDHVVLPRQGRISSPAGTEHVEPKVMELLVSLAERPGDVVTRNELIDAVWGRALGADESLTRSVSSLRQALGDSPRAPRFLETVPKRGYRLLAPVQPLATPEAPPASVAEPPPASIAVLPFVSLSDEPDNEYFADGLAIELLTALSRIEGLQVASRLSSFAFKGRAADVRSVGEQLNVRAVLAGTVQKSGDRLRISAELVNVRDGFQLWSGRLDRRMQDIFAVQDEIAGNIVDALSVRLDPTLRLAACCPGLTEDVRAYEHYLRAWGFFRRFGPGNLNKARELFRRAIEIEPGYAAAWAGLSISASFLYMYYDSRREICDEADEASRTALRFGPELAEAHTARGLAHSLAARYDEAEVAFEESILRDPQRFEPYYCYARVCMQQGKRHKAAALFRKAMQVEPDDFQSPLLLAQLYLEMGDEARARETAHRGVETAERHLEQHPDDPRALSMPLGTLHRLGRHEQARGWAQRALAVDGENPGTLYNVACHFAVDGEPDRALDCLEKSVLPGAAIGDWIEQDNELDSLRGLPRFDALLDRLRGQTACAVTDPAP